MVRINPKYQEQDLFIGDKAKISATELCERWHAWNTVERSLFRQIAEQKGCPFPLFLQALLSRDTEAVSQIFTK